MINMFKKSNDVKLFNELLDLVDEYQEGNMTNIDRMKRFRVLLSWAIEEINEAVDGMREKLSEINNKLSGFDKEHEQEEQQELEQ